MIRSLPPHIVHQIAAGEVIEKPASVLKECLENSLDANASRIIIEFEEAGLKSLKIDDNGCGIPREDLPLAFAPHATSKLRDLDDFLELHTFGFRGEALCSIASVADVSLCSSLPEAEVAFRLRSRFGEIGQVEPADKREGTEIYIRDLFARHPARLKFMKTARSEALALHQMFKKYAVSHPEVSFAFRDLSGSKKTELRPTTLFDRVLWFFGGEDSEHWFETESQSAEWKIKIVALKPRYSGLEASGLSLFLNLRPFKDQKLEFAVRRGFEGFTLNPRDIAAIVMLEGSPALFDVNVHPTKQEVRFLEAEKLFSQIVHSLRQALETQHRAVLQPSKNMPTYSPPEIVLAEEILAVQELYRPPAVNENSDLSLEMGPRFGETLAPSEERQKTFAFATHTPAYEFLGTFDETYLLVKKDQELLVFDQHALHERILYERLLAEFSSSSCIASQRLLFPVPVMIENAEEHEAFLEKLGFEFRAWNDGKFQLVAAPAILKRGYAEVLAKLTESVERSEETLARDILATIACHSAVRAHDRIEKVEAERLLKEFATEDALGHCPHGRPTFVRFQTRDFEKFFQRVV